MVDNSQQIVGLAALYAVIEIIKFMVEKSRAKEPAPFTAKNQAMMNDLHQWHSRTDDDGRLLWYTPKHIHTEQERMVEMLREIAHSQETTARILGELVREMSRK